MILTLIIAAAAATQPPPDLPGRWLARHNAARAAVGVPPLAWDKALAADAGRWARQLAQTGTFDHAPDDPARPPQGENLWMGTRGAYSPEEMIDDWIDERAQYRAGVFPDVAARGTWHDVGHYTQIIWSRTTAVGCALAANASDDVLVCRYAPAGNVIGERPIAAVTKLPVRAVRRR